MTPQPPTDRMDDITSFVFDLLTAHKDQLQVEDVWYGDQNKIPRTPAICVYADSKTREPITSGRGVTNTFAIRVDVYHFTVSEVQEDYRAVLGLAENVEVVLHLDITLNGLAYDSLVVGNDAGILDRNGSRFKGNRLNFVVKSRTLLPMRPGYNQ